MNSAYAGLSLALALLAPAWASAAPGPWTAALYLAGDSDLWQTAQYAANTALGATAKGMTTAVLLDGPPGPSSSARLSVRSGGRMSVRDLGRLDTGSPSTLARFVARAYRLRAIGPRALVILGHGKPPVSTSGPWQRVTIAGGLGEDWGAGGDSLDPAEIEKAMAGRKWDVVVLACCYGASAEQLWALRKSARYVVAAPGELSMTGGEIGRIVAFLASRPTAREAAARAADILAGTSGGVGSMWVAGGRMDTVARRVREFGQALRHRAGTCAEAIETVRPLLPTWGPGGEMADLGALAKAMSESVADAGVKSAAEALAGEVSAAVHKVGGVKNPKAAFAPTDIGIFLPPLQTEPWKDYEKHAPFGRATGWTLALAALHRAVGEDGSAAGLRAAARARQARTEAMEAASIAAGGREQCRGSGAEAN